MMSHASPSLAELRLALRRNGYRPVPVAGKRPWLKNWQRVCATADEGEIERWSSAFPTCTNTGVLCGDTVGVDIDITDETLAASVEALAREVLGPTPLKRIGRAPKLLLAFRAEQPFAKVQTPELILHDGTVVRVEVLATGQQFVGFGIHPDTKRDYFWPARSPLDVPASELPAVTAVQCAALVNRVEALLRGAGAQTAAERRQTDRDGRKHAGFGPHEKPSREIVVEALAHIPNNDLPYDEWIRVGFALYDGLGDAGRDLWEDWSAQSAKNDAAVTARKWPSFAQGHTITVGTLFWIAKQNGWRQAGKANGEAGEERSGAANAKPQIRLLNGELPYLVQQGQAILAASGEVFRRDSQLVRVTRLGGKTRGTEATQAVGSLAIALLSTEYARLLLGEGASFERFDSRSKKWLPTDAPKDVAKTLVDAAGRWHDVHELRGVVEAPTLRPDGSVLGQPGFDEPSGIYFDSGGCAFATVPDAPTRADAQAALDKFEAILSGFPFVDAPSRSVAIAAIITALVRRSLRAAPLFVITAPKMGSGKTLLATLPAYIATGRPPGMMTLAGDDDSERKRLLAVLIEGGCVAVIDNVERPLQSEALCTVLTEPIFRDRLLGVSRTVSAPTNVTWIATGNNLVVAGDLTSRVLVARLDPECERPEEREFADNLHQEVPRRRGELATAALTVVRAYLAAGSPRLSVATFGRFEAWQEWCRFPLLWLGLADPCDTRGGMEARDPVRELLVPLLQAWHALLGEVETTVAQAIKASDPDGFPSMGKSEAKARLRDALVEVSAEPKGELNARRIGAFIAKHEGRIEGGLKFLRGAKRNGVVSWRAASRGSGG